MDIEALSDDQVQREVMGVVRAMFPNVTVPDPVAFYFPRWHSDPLYRGSYSNYSPSVVPQHQQNIKAPIGQRLWFAGEHVDLKHFGESRRGSPRRLRNQFGLHLIRIPAWRVLLRTRHRDTNDRLYSRTRMCVCRRHYRGGEQGAILVLGHLSFDFSARQP